MSRVGLVRALKAVVLIIACIAAVFYVLVFPQLIGEIGRIEKSMTWLVVPYTVAVSVSAIPIAAALVLFWQICTDIGRDSSFSVINAKRLRGIGVCAVVDTVYCMVGTISLMVVTPGQGGHPSMLLAAAVAVFGGLAIALASFLLSRLVQKAAELKAEHDLTI